MENVKVIELTDEEIWLRAYCASISNSKTDRAAWLSEADGCLSDFKERFRMEKENGK